MSINEAIPSSEGSRHLITIRQAMDKRRPISFVYKNEKGEIVAHNAVYPRRVFQKANHMYLEAYCHFTSDVRLFRLDRISSLKVVTERTDRRRKQGTFSWVTLVIAALAILLLLMYFLTTR